MTAPATNKPKIWSKITKIVVRTLLIISLFFGTLLLGAVIFLLFPPSDLIRRALLPVARHILKHEKIHIGSLTLKPFSKIEIKNIWIGPPDGYKLPMLTVRRITLCYDLSKLLQNKIQITKLEIDQPVLSIESHKNKLNWLAFIEALPKSKETSQKKPIKTNKDPRQITMFLDDFKIQNIGAVFRDNKMQAAFTGLYLFAKAMLGPKSEKIDFSIELREPKNNKANILFDLKDKKAPLLVQLRTGLKIQTQIDQLNPPRAKAQLDLKIATSKLLSSWNLQPTQLAFHTDIAIDADQAKINSLFVFFNKTKILDLAGKIDKIENPQNIWLNIKKLYLPLDEFASYAKVFVNNIDFGGDISLENFDSFVPIASVKEKQLPKMNGQLIIKNIWAHLFEKKQSKLALEQLNAKVDFASQQENKIQVNAKFNLGHLNIQKAKISKLALNLNTEAALKNGMPQTFVTKLFIDAPSIKYSDPSIGPIQLSLRSNLTTSGDISQELINIHSFDLNLANLINTKLKATIKNFKSPKVNARINLLPLDLFRLRQLIPSKFKKIFDELNLRGKVGLSIAAKGNIPKGHISPLKIPVSVEAEIQLDKVSLQKGTSVLKSLDGEIKINGKPDNLDVATNLTLERLYDRSLKTNIRKLELPIDIHIKPQQIECNVLAKIKEFSKKDLGHGNGLHLGIKASATLDDLQKLIRKPELPQSTHLQLSINADKFISTFLSQPLKNSKFVINSSLTNNGDLKLKQLSIALPTFGFNFKAWGDVKKILDSNFNKQIPPFDLNILANIDNPQSKIAQTATLLLKDLKTSGKIGIDLHLRQLSPKEISTEGRILANKFNLWTKSTATIVHETKTTTQQTSFLHVKDLSAQIPFSQNIYVDLSSSQNPIDLPLPKESIFKIGTSSALYNALRPYLSRRNSFYLESVSIDQQLTEINAAKQLVANIKRNLNIGKISLDLEAKDSSILLDRLYMNLLGGDIVGALKLQKLGLQTPDMRIYFKTQITGINLAHLDPHAKTFDKETEVSALVDLKYQLCRPDKTFGQIEITHISLKHLDALLAFLDPNKVDKQIQLTRSMLTGTLANMVKPKVKHVSITIKHANADLDIRIETRPIFRLIQNALNNIFEKNPIRRKNILLLLPQICGES